MAYESEIEKLKRRYDEKPEQWFAALADAHRKAGDLEQAIRIVEEGIKQRPNYVSGHIVLGRCLVDQGADDRAEKVFEEVLELDAENIIALKVLGDVSERRGNREAARRWLGRLLEVDPMNDEARAMLDRVSQPQGAPAVAPAEPDLPIQTQSAARAAGVASTGGKTEEQPTSPDSVEDGDLSDQDVETPLFAPSNVPETTSMDSSASVRDLLDAAIKEEQSPEVPVDQDSDAERDAGLVIEQTSEAISSDEHLAMDLPPLESLSESETQAVSFEESVPSQEPGTSEEDDSADLAAGTLDFVAESTDVERDAGQPAQSAAEDDFLDLRLTGESAEEAQPAPDQIPSADVSGEEELPEDVASIFASAAPISQLSPSDDVDGRRPDEAEEATGDTERPLPESMAEFDVDFVPAELEQAPGGDLGSVAERGADFGVTDEAGAFTQDLAGASQAATPTGAESEDEESSRTGASDDVQQPALDDSVADAVTDSAIVGSILSPGQDSDADAPSSLVTETMAEVYASQGHFDQARDVYRKLLADSPGDVGLQQRLAALEDRAHQAAGARGAGEPPRQYAASQTGGESVRSMLEGLLSIVPGQTDVQSEDEVVFVTPSEPSPLEQAFGASESPPGEPARPASDSPSLASVFGDEPSTMDEPAHDEAVPDKDAPELTYDGFYGSSEDEPKSMEQDEAESDDDEEFKAWLQSLKS